MKYLAVCFFIMYSSIALSGTVAQGDSIDCYGKYFGKKSVVVHSVDDVVRAYRNLAPKHLKSLYARAAQETEVELTVSEFQSVGDIFYNNQAKLVIEHCSELINGFSEFNGYEVVDETTSSFIFEMGLRDVGMREIDEVLPFLLGRNVTERVNFVVLAYYCSESDTPKISAALSTFGIKCYGEHSKKQGSGLIF